MRAVGVGLALRVEGSLPDVPGGPRPDSPTAIVVRHALPALS